LNAQRRPLTTYEGGVSIQSEARGAADHWNFREDDNDYYTQPGKLFRLISPAQQKVLFENTARAMGDSPREIKIRHIRNCMKADSAYGKGVADALEISLNEVVHLPAPR
jgi:catalase